MSKTADGSPVSPALAPLSEHAHLATPPEMIRWDLGERATLDRPKERLAVVRIAGRNIAIEGRFSRGVQALGEPTAIPLTPEHILGLCHVRGGILPVVDLALFVDPAAHHGRRSAASGRTALVLQIDQEAICLCVDEVIAFEPFQMDRLQARDDDPNDPWHGLWAGQAILELADLEVGESSDRMEVVPVLDLPATIAALRFGEPS